MPTRTRTAGNQVGMLMCHCQKEYDAHKIMFHHCQQDRQNEDNSTLTPHDDNRVVLKKGKSDIDMLLEADEIQATKKTLKESRAGEGKGIGNENS
eukprot:9617830-Ditylum_brightwellii.AAC.1